MAEETTGKKQMKNLERRLARIEVRFGSMIEATRKVADLFSPEAILLRLAAGEWQCALNLLKRQHCDRCQVWRPEPRDLIDIPFTGLTRLRQMLERSLGALPDELRFEIAHQLLATDVSHEST